MTETPLTRIEASFLQAAAADGGLLRFPETMKPTSRMRLVGRFLRDGLITSPETSDGVHRLTAAGYTAIGHAPPKVKASRGKRGGQATTPSDPSVASVASTPSISGIEASEAAPSNKALLRALLEREAGATIPEIIAATGWLPHTTRAALSRLRSSGQTLVKATRPDASMAYRIPATVQATASRARRTRRGATTGAAMQAVA